MKKKRKPQTKQERLTSSLKRKIKSLEREIEASYANENDLVDCRRKVDQDLAERTKQLTEAREVCQNLLTERARLLEYQDKLQKDLAMKSVAMPLPDLFKVEQLKTILGYCADFVRDLENRYLLECHDCGKDIFRWKSISISRDFMNLRMFLKPFGRKDGAIPAVNNEFKLPDDKN
jgi:hypothetical protein